MDDPVNAGPGQAIGLGFLALFVVGSLLLFLGAPARQPGTLAISVGGPERS